MTRPFLTLCLAQLILGAAAHAAGVDELSTGDLVITELMNNPGAVPYYRGQWIEIYNASGGEVDLENLVVSDGASQTFTVSSSVTVAAGEYAVLAVRASSSENGGITPDYTYDIGDFSLSSGTDTVEISFGATVFDTITYDNGTTFPDPLGSSMSLNPSALDATSNDTGGNWCEAASTFGDGDYGTPGSANDACPVDISNLSAGDLLVTEIMHDPSSVIYYKGEWLEVYNNSAFYVDLNGLEVSDSGSDIFVVDESVALRPGEYAVFAVRDNPAVNGGIEGVDFRYIYGSEMILAANDDITLSYGIVTFDTVAWDSGSFPATSGVAMELGTGSFDATSNDDGSNWCGSSLTYGDGDYGSPGDANGDCDTDTDGDGYAEGDDCDDNNAAINPGATEVCDSVDNDCDGNTDEDPSDGTTYYADTDGDYYGDPGSTIEACERPADYRTNALDCDDTDGTISPSATEICDGIDNDCDTTIDVNAADATAWYPDGDSDGYGDESSPALVCSQPSGYIADGSDCNDADAAINPLAAETCDGTDDNCSGNENDASDASTYYADLDHDYYGDSGNTTAACTRPSGFRINALDCNDSDSGINPGATETCDGIDNNCSGDESDAADAPTWYLDDDSDGYGDVTVFANACTQPSGYLADSTDCDDAAANVNPGESETCDGTDNNCSGDETDAVDATTWYADADSDGFGDVASLTTACSQPGGYTADSTDCDDSEGTTYPGAPETCSDGVDSDCDTIDSMGTCDASLTGADATFSGESSGDLAGYHMTGGDINGDGYSDVIIGARLAHNGGTDRGSTYVVFGPVTGTMGLGSADAELTGESDNDYAGGSVASGDFNNDGYDDLLIGALNEDAGGTDAGAAYMVFGPVSGDVGLAGADAKLTGTAAGDQAGKSVAAVGDVDNDGSDDLLIASYKNDDAGANTGAAYLFYGPATSGDLDTADAIIQGAAEQDFAGSWVSAAGDVDGDGYADVLIGAYRADTEREGNPFTNVGISYLLHGPLSGTINLSAANASFIGESDSDQSGAQLSEAGDVNNDGYADFLIGAERADSNGTDSGSAYLILGPVSGEVELSSADAIFTGEAADDRAGRGVGAAGDLDGDGNDDILVGAKENDNSGTGAGAAYVILGPITGTLSLSASDAIYTGVSAGDQAGMWVGGAGDVSGDGTSDFLIGGNSAASGAGATYLILGDSWR